MRKTPRKRDVGTSVRASPTLA